METDAHRPKPRIFHIVLAFVVISLLFASIIGNFVLGGLLLFFGLENQHASVIRDAFPKMVISGTGKSEILLLEINGIIGGHALPTGNWTQPAIIHKKLTQAANDPAIKAVILKINSPGGTVTASDDISRYIINFREKTKKPVVAYLDSIAASGGYYIAVASDSIVCNATCITGSIGVIMSFYQLQDLLENKLGIKQVTIKSGIHKDIASPTRPMTTEEKKILQSMVDEMYQRFLSVVIRGRAHSKLAKLTETALKKIADGRVYTGTQAQKIGLVDSLGYFQDSMTKAKNLAHIPGNCTLVQYHKQRSLIENLLNPVLQKQNSVFKQISSHTLNPGFYYLWLLRY